MYSVQEIGEEQERQYNRLMEEDDQYCHPESFRWGFEHGFEYALSKFGWHPASEHPPVDKETGFSELVVGIMPGDTVGFPQYVRYQKNEFYDRWIYGYTGVPSAINIKWWCYPPKEE